MPQKLIRKALVKKLAQTISKNSKNKKVFIVGLSGPDLAGKTRLTKNLLKELKQKKLNVVSIPSDWFHFPRRHRRAAPGQPHQQFLYHTINFDRLIKEVLIPISQQKEKITFTHFNVDTNKGIKKTIKLKYPLVLIIEGIFLFQKKLNNFFDFKIYLEVTPENIIKRAIRRDAYRFGEAEEVRKRYETKYNRGQALHRKKHKPLKLAHWIVDNNDWQKPVVKISQNPKKPL